MMADTSPLLVSRGLAGVSLVPGVSPGAFRFARSTIRYAQIS